MPNIPRTCSLVFEHISNLYTTAYVSRICRFVPHLLFHFLRALYQFILQRFIYLDDNNNAASAERISGTPQNDNLTGTSDNDRISGSGGNDTLIGLSGSDEIDGGRGIDTISGSEGDYYLIGCPNNDVRPVTMKLKVTMEMIRCLEELEVIYCLVEEVKIL
jgi:RTX calcium-binding nonapeptide repeat (4 copies)